MKNPRLAGTSWGVMEVQSIHSLNYSTNLDTYTNTYISQKDALADWLRMLDPWEWFATLTFKQDIRTYRRENPTRHIERYQWVESTPRYPNGTYVRIPDELKLEPVRSDWLSDISYNKDVQERFARSQYLIWIRALNEEIYGRRFREHGLGVDNAYGMELQKRGVIHLHAVLKGIPKDVSLYEWAKKWWNQHGNNGYATIEPYDPELGAVGYLGKYIVKDGQVDLWLSKRTLGQVQRVEVIPADHLL